MCMNMLPARACCWMVQTDLLEILNTRTVVPLLPQDLAPKPASRLNPIFRIEDEPYVMVTQFISAVPMAALGKPVVSLEADFAEISNALDMLFQGF